MKERRQIIKYQGPRAATHTQKKEAARRQTNKRQQKQIKKASHKKGSK